MTSAIINFKEVVNKKAHNRASIYINSDGYPSYTGVQLAKTLSKMTFVNGLSADDGNNVVNGFGDMVAHYLEKIGAFESVFLATDYTYTVKMNRSDYLEKTEGGKRVKANSLLEVTVHDDYENKKIFKGSLKELIAEYNES